MINIVTEQLNVALNPIYTRRKGTLLDDYYRVVCSRGSITRRASQVILFYLENQGLIRINWHSPHGATMYPISKCKLCFL